MFGDDDLRAEERVKLTCPTCGSPSRMVGESTTLVGYYSPPGHDHNDNCVKRRYVCRNEHVWMESRQNRCSTPGCEWVGKASCFCHGDKVKEWSE